MPENILVTDDPSSVREPSIGETLMGVLEGVARMRFEKKYLSGLSAEEAFMKMLEDDIGNFIPSLGLMTKGQAIGQLGKTAFKENAGFLSRNLPSEGRAQWDFVKYAPEVIEQAERLPEKAFEKLNQISWEKIHNWGEAYPDKGLVLLNSRAAWDVAKEDVLLHELIHLDKRSAPIRSNKAYTDWNAFLNWPEKRSVSVNPEELRALIGQVKGRLTGYPRTERQWDELITEAGSSVKGYVTNVKPDLNRLIIDEVVAPENVQPLKEKLLSLEDDTGILHETGSELKVLEYALETLQNNLNHWPFTWPKPGSKSPFANLGQAARRMMKK